MNEKKLKLATIGTLVGAFVLIVAMVLVWKFRFYDNVVSELEATNTKYSNPGATTPGEKEVADRLKPALEAALLSQQRLALAEGELQYFRTRFRSLPFDITESPTTGKAPLNATFVRYLNEYALGFGTNARDQLLRAARDSGVVIDTKITINAPPQNPEDIRVPANGFLKPQGGALDVTVTGTLPAILNFFQIINRSQILMVVGTVKMEGLSPAIVASFSVTPYLLVTGPSASVAPIANVNAAFPGATAAAAPDAAGGAGAGGAAGQVAQTEGEIGG